MSVGLFHPLKIFYRKRRRPCRASGKFLQGRTCPLQGEGPHGGAVSLSHPKIPLGNPPFPRSHETSRSLVDARLLLQPRWVMLTWLSFWLGSDQPCGPPGRGDAARLSLSPAGWGCLLPYVQMKTLERAAGAAGAMSSRSWEVGALGRSWGSRCGVVLEEMDGVGRCAVGSGTAAA